MYNVCCGAVSWRIFYKSINFKIKKPSIVVSLILHLLFFISKLLFSSRIISKKICGSFSLCDKCNLKRLKRYEMYHLTKDTNKFLENLKVYFKNEFYNYEAMAVQSIYEIELLLRDTYCQQYFDGELDYGHEKWNRHLRIMNTKKYSKHFWNEVIFNSHSLPLNYENLLYIKQKYDLINFKDQCIKYSMYKNLELYNLEIKDNLFINDEYIVNQLYNKLGLDYW